MVPTRWRRWLQFCWSENNRLLDPVFFLRSVFPLQNLAPLPDFFECFFDPQGSFGNPLRTFRQYLASPVLEKSRLFLLRRDFPPYYARTSRMPPRPKPCGGKNMFMLFTFWPWFCYSKRTDAIIESLNTLKPGFHMVVTVANLSKWPM